MATQQTTFTLKDFTDLDHSPHGDFLIESMKAHYSVKGMQDIKNKAIDLLKLTPGDSVIELGCGLGYDAEKMSLAVGKQGSVVALDSSQRMIDEAKKRSTQKNVIYSVGDANHLQFENNSFSACRADRLLVSQKNVNQVFSEAVRVTKSGGRVCFTALNFYNVHLSPNINTLNLKIINYWRQLVENPFIGQQLPLLYERHKINHIETYPETFAVNSFDTFKKIVPFETMLNDMHDIGLISASEKNKIIHVFVESDRTKSFYWSIDLITMVGTKMMLGHDVYESHT